MVSYQLGLTLGEKIWEDLMPNPPVDLQDLMSWMEMFACLGDDVRQAEQASGSSSRGDGSFKRHKERTADNEDRVRKGINVVFGEPIYKLLTRIREKLYYRKLAPMEGHPKKCIQRWKCAFHEEK